MKRFIVFNILLLSISGQTQTKIDFGTQVKGSAPSIKYASDFNWKRKPTNPATLSPGTATITLSPCPAGFQVNANGLGVSGFYVPTQSVYIAGTGIPEAVKVTPVSGHAGDASCQFSGTIVNSHDAGYVVGSASGGIKEASEAARSQVVPYNNWFFGGTVVIDSAGSPYKVYAPLHFEASWQTINNAGGQIQCYVPADDCIVVGRRDAGYNNVHNITLNDLVVNAANGNLYSDWDAVHVNAQSTTIHNLKVGPSDATNPVGSFNSYISICDDESFTADGLDVWNGQGLRKDARGQVIYALPEGATRNSNNCFAVGWLRSINGNLQCQGSLVNWLSGNGLHISDSIVQGFSRYGIRTGAPTGGFNGNTQIDNAYFEVGACTNPDYIAAELGGNGTEHNTYQGIWSAGTTYAQFDYVSFSGVFYLAAAPSTGVTPGTDASIWKSLGSISSSARAQAGVITQGGQVNARGSTGFTGQMPTFLCSGSAGNTSFNYWAVPNQSGAGQGNGGAAPLYLGNSIGTCSGTLTGYFPAILAAVGGTVLYDIVRNVGSGGNIIAPYAGGCTGGSVNACGSVISGMAQSGKQIETFTDDVSRATSSYSPPTIAFVPYLGFWPGNLVLSATVPNNRTAVPVATFVGEQNLGGGNGIGIVSVNGAYAPSTFSLSGTGGPGGLLGGGSATLGGIDVHLGGYNTATLLMRNQQANQEAVNLKGRLNFIGDNLAGFAPGSIVTLVDSNPDKTVATATYRPVMDATDVWVGTDGASNANFSRTTVPLAFGGPVTISNYINSLPDGINWRERLTASAKIFKVPMQLGSFAQPTCNVSNQGMFNYIAGGAGVKDTVQVCAKDAQDAYAWRAIF